MTVFRAIVLEHFRHPRNRGTLDAPTAEAEGANPLCGDRIRIQVRVDDGVVHDARFTADACALCIASASLLTEHARGRRVNEIDALDVASIAAWLEGEPPLARRKCALLPLDTLRRALATAPPRSSE
jgi:nitrogen fixation NifU-like protein